jgi:RHS repeat-associated protein
VSNGVPSVVPPQTLNSYYDPQSDCLELGVTLSSAPDTEFLEAGTSPSVQTTWKLYGPDANGVYGGLNGTGGLEGDSPYLNTFNPVISDARGNVLAEVTNGTASWTLARPTAYGSVPGYRPVAYGNGVDLMQSSALRGREVDVTGLYYFHHRYYDPVSGQWLSYDPSWNERDPNGQSYNGGDPVNYFDAMGLMGKDIGPSLWGDLPPQQGDAVDAYNQVEAQMGLAERFDPSAPISAAQSFSSLADMIPFVGGLKMWVEVDSGVDLFSGQRIQGSDWMQAAMIGLNILPLAFEAAPEEAAVEDAVNIPFGSVTQVGSKGAATTYDSLMSQVAAADFSTPRNGAVFWTGYSQGNQTTAMSWAAANGKYTIEMTPGGQWLTGLKLYGADSPVTEEEANAIWQSASEQFASGVSGSVNAFTRGTTFNPGSAFYNTELPILQGRTITYRGY